MPTNPCLQAHLPPFFIPTSKPVHILRLSRFIFVLVLMAHIALAAFLHHTWHTQTPTPTHSSVIANILPNPPNTGAPSASRPAISTHQSAHPVPTHPTTKSPAQTLPKLDFDAPHSLMPSAHNAPPAGATTAPSTSVNSTATSTENTPNIPNPSTPSNTRQPITSAASVKLDSCAKPLYPIASQRLQEEGVVVLKFLVDENGKALKGLVEKSSGFKRLDDAALAALSLCAFKPAHLDGKPRQEWSMIQYRWQLPN